jgi:hypothetical protein
MRTSEAQGTLAQLSKFNLAVAIDARIRRHPELIGFNEAINDLLLEGRFEIHDVVRHIELRSYSAGIIKISGRATGRLAGIGAALFVVPHLHRHTNELSARFGEEIRSDGGINTT